MSPEIAHSHNVLARQMPVDFGLTGSHLGAPCLENLDRGAVGDLLGYAPAHVTAHHDGFYDSANRIKDVAASGLHKLRHAFPQFFYDLSALPRKPFLDQNRNGGLDQLPVRNRTQATACRIKKLAPRAVIFTKKSQKPHLPLIGDAVRMRTIRSERVAA